MTLQWENRKTEEFCTLIPSKTFLHVKPMSLFSFIFGVDHSCDSALVDGVLSLWKEYNNIFKNKKQKYSTVLRKCR